MSDKGAIQPGMTGETGQLHNRDSVRVRLPPRLSVIGWWQNTAVGGRETNQKGVLVSGQGASVTAPSRIGHEQDGRLWCSA